MSDWLDERMVSAALPGPAAAGVWHLLPGGGTDGQVSLLSLPLLLLRGTGTSSASRQAATMITDDMLSDDPMASCKQVAHCIGWTCKGLDMHYTS